MIIKANEERKVAERTFGKYTTPWNEYALFVLGD
jgi:hypothetical protein